MTELILGGVPEALGGRSSIKYPSNLPVFADVGEAIDAVMDSAYDHWGADAEDHVEVAFMMEVAEGRQDEARGALAGWTNGDGEGAVWLLRSCTCTDGTLAQFFTTGPC